MAEGIDMDELLNSLLAADLNVDRVFMRMVQAPYRGKVLFSHLQKMSPEDFNSIQHVEIIQWFRRFKSKFVLFEDDSNKVRVCGVRIPSAKICPRYIGITGNVEGGQEGCTDAECFMYHVCRKYIAGGCKAGPNCPHDHHFQSEHNLRLLKKQNLNNFDESDLQTILAQSQLSICDQYNEVKSNGYCPYNDRCVRLHLCEKFVRGTCNGKCNLSHELKDSMHSLRLLKYYALDDKPQQEVLRNLLIVRRKQQQQQQAASKARDEQRLKLLETILKLGATEKSETTQPKECTSETAGPAAEGSSATEEKVVASGGHSNKPVWQLEIFGSWTTLSPEECEEIDKQFSDPNQDNFHTSVVLGEFGEEKQQLLVDFEHMAATLLSEDLQPSEKLNLKRDETAADQWIWYWQHDDNGWRSYTEPEQIQLEAGFKRETEKKISIGSLMVYDIRFSKMTQTNRQSGRVRHIRRRPRKQ